MRILVTGASGFIGGVVCRRLLEQDHEVVALVRRPGSGPPGTSAIAGDLSAAADLAPAVSQAAPDCVVHLAAEIASQRSEAKIQAVNVGGTARLIEACVASASGTPASGPRFVFSSTVVTGEAGGRVLSEEEPLPVETPYGRSKQQCEQMLRSSGLPAVVIRPSHVYGPGGWYAHELLPRLRAPGRLAVIGNGRNLWDVVHVEDVASAIVLAAGSERATGRTYHVADDEPITFYDFMALSAEALGVGPPRRIPAGLARLVAGRHTVTALLRSARSSNARIKDELGWSPRFPSAREGVPDAVARIVAAWAAS